MFVSNCQVLAHIDKRNLLPPLMVVDVLARNSNATLAVIKVCMPHCLMRVSQSGWHVTVGLSQSAPHVSQSSTSVSYSGVGCVPGCNDVSLHAKLVTVAHAWVTRGTLSHTIHAFSCRSTHVTLSDAGVALVTLSGVMSHVVYFLGPCHIVSIPCFACVGLHYAAIAAGGSRHRGGRAQDPPVPSGDKADAAADLGPGAVDRMRVLMCVMCYVMCGMCTCVEGVRCVWCV